MKRICLLVCFCLCLQHLLAQIPHTVSGVIKDTTGQEIIAANIWLTAGKDSLHAASDETGRFTFSNVNQSVFSLRVSVLGYETWSKSFDFKNAGPRIELPPVILLMKTSNLQEVVVKGRQAPVVVKEDTLEYRASQYRLRENAVAEDLLKRLPGVDVDKDGNVTMMGKKITKLRINGKDYLVDDIKTLTRILPVDMIEKVQLIDDYGYMARATGRKSGEPQQVLNIQTKAELNKGIQMQTIVGAGNDGRYNGAILANFFNGENQLSVSGNTNNTSALSGSAVNSNATINYREQTSKGLSLNGSLMGAHTASNIQSLSNVTTVTNEGTLYIANNSSNYSNNNNYAFYGGAEYKPDNGDILNVNVNMSMNTAGNESTVSSLQTGYQQKDQVTQNIIDNRIPVVGGGVFASHRFNKKGRALSLSFYMSYTGNKNDQDGINNILYYNADSTVAKDSLLHQLLTKNNNDLITSSQVSWIEPIDSTSSLELRYLINYTKSDNTQITDWLSLEGKYERIESLSNTFKYSMSQQQLELNYRKSIGRFDYTLGARLMPSGLSGKGTNGQAPTKLHSNPLAPVLRIQYKLPRSQFISLFYNGVVIFPAFQQLQPVPDLTNAQFPIVGNPLLKPGFTHSVFLNYRSLNTASSHTLFLHLAANYTKDKVVTNTVTVQDSFNTVKQETRYLNTDGDYNYRFVYGWSKRLRDGKYNFYLDGTAAYNNNILYVQDVKNIAKNLTFSQSARSNMLLNWIELMTGVTYAYNRNVYIPSDNNITNLTTWTINVVGKVYFLKTFAIGIDANKQLNSGYSGSLSSNPLMANAFLEKMFFKKSLTCRAQVFNLLNENARLSQFISGNSVTESRDNLLSRYFMLSLQLDLKKFKSGK
ncbi:Outer membrane receptor proteins, mostly Fe transport [Chitinophaga sp. CF118]|uniref:outer membrane beta-barrel protein n=1 Tax=Chitinophaga sp. CF118 TaxID=1884367 RepID=UPI0008E4A057|nr:outer membrane beta-barrel protein [Chitinophaga sp. CF118]SFE06288.1 Outer membrane receptor proteins, mostly Fe transport [Chitinophaga sp. CF118]